eukprot:745814-Hanusia_phi.AAC.3
MTDIHGKDFVHLAWLNWCQECANEESDVAENQHQKRSLQVIRADQCAQESAWQSDLRGVGSQQNDWNSGDNSEREDASPTKRRRLRNDPTKDLGNSRGCRLTCNWYLSLTLHAAGLKSRQSTLKNSTSAQLISALWKRPPQELFAQLRALEKLTSWIRRRSNAGGSGSNTNTVNNVAAVAASAPQPPAPVVPASNAGPSSIPAPPWVQKMTETVPGCKGYPKAIRDLVWVKLSSGMDPKEIALQTGLQAKTVKKWKDRIVEQGSLGETEESAAFDPLPGTPYALPNGALQRKKPIAEGEEEKKRKPRVRVRDKAYMAEAMRRYRLKKKIQGGVVDVPGSLPPSMLGVSSQLLQLQVQGGQVVGGASSVPVGQVAVQSGHASVGHAYGHGHDFSPPRTPMLP